MEPLRSLLFVPGNRERFLQKALTQAADQGTCALDGKMIDTAIALRAQKLLRIAEAVAQKGPVPRERLPF